MLQTKMTSVVYVDEKWSWRIPIAASVSNLLIIGYLKGFGILMIAYREEWHFNNTYLMIVLGMNIASIGILAPVAEHLSKWFTSTTVVFISGVFVFTSIVISSFVKNPAVFILFMGIVNGLGFACAYTPPLCLTGVTFKRWRSAATGVAYAGASLGQIAMPLCFDYLIERYTLSGALLLIAGIFGNICVLGLMLPSKVIDRESCQFILKHGSFSKLTVNRWCSEMRQWREAKSSVNASEHINPSWKGSALFLLFICIINFSYTNQYVMFPNYARENSFTRRTVSHLIVIQGVTDLIFRIATGIAANRLSLQGRTRLVVVALIIQGVVAFLMSQKPNFAIFIAYSIVFGITGAVYMSQWSVILVGTVGVLSFPTFFTRCMFLMGISNMVLTFLMGVLRDLVGTYSWGLLIAATNACIAGLLLTPAVNVGRKMFKDQRESSDEMKNLKGDSSKNPETNV